MTDKIKEISRVRRTKEEAKDTYDKLSPLYDTIIGRIEKKYRDAGLRMLNTGEGEKILEVGFGPGHCLVPLAKSVGTSGKCRCGGCLLRWFWEESERLII